MPKTSIFMKVMSHYMMTTYFRWHEITFCLENYGLTVRYLFDKVLVSSLRRLVSGTHQLSFSSNPLHGYHVEVWTHCSKSNYKSLIEVGWIQMTAYDLKVIRMFFELLHEDLDRMLWCIYLVDTDHYPLLPMKDDSGLWWYLCTRQLSVIVL